MTEVKSLYDIGFEHGYTKAKEEVKPKTGHWIEKIIYSHSYAECSECKTVYSWSETETMRFCKRCGADMRGEERETD